MNPISVIIPTLNVENVVIGALRSLITLNGLDLIHEVIFSDGGSKDSTERIALISGAEFISGNASRGKQLRRGIEASEGPWLLILHADTKLSKGWEKECRSFIQKNECTAGYFRFALEDKGIRPYLLTKLVSLRCRFFSLPYGDQGLLISRRLYESVGGYKEIPLMEDVDLIRRIGRNRLREIPVEAITSAVRYKKGGYFSRTIRNILCLSLFCFGISPENIKKFYDRP